MHTSGQIPATAGGCFRVVYVASAALCGSHPLPPEEAFTAEIPVAVIWPVAKQATTGSLFDGMELLCATGALTELIQHSVAAAHG